MSDLKAIKERLADIQDQQLVQDIRDLIAEVERLQEQEREVAAQLKYMVSVIEKRRGDAAVLTRMAETMMTGRRP